MTAAAGGSVVEGTSVGNDVGVGVVNGKENVKNASNEKPVIENIRAVLFDLDGTLLDTEALSDKAMLLSFGGGDGMNQDVWDERVKAGHRLPWELKKQILGLRGSEWSPLVVNYAIDHGWAKQGEDDSSSLSPQELWDRWEENLSNLCEEVDACPGASELVSNLAAHNIPMAIATSSRYAAVSKKRKRHENNMFEHIATIVAGDDDAVTNGKPAPDIYLEAAQRLGVDPSQCLVFEDAMSGVKAGKAAGCYVVAVPDPRFTPEEKAEFHQVADVVLDDLWQFQGKPWGIDVDLTVSSAKHKPSSESESPAV